MGVTPDRFPGSREEDELVLRPATEDPATEGALRYVNGAWRLVDGSGVFDPRTGGSGLTPAQHNALDQLVHDVTESCFYEIAYSGNRITTETWWTDATKTTKVREIGYTYSGSLVTTETWRQYDGAGVEVEALTITYTYSGNRVVSATYVRS